MERKTTIPKARAAFKAALFETIEKSNQEVFKSEMAAINELKMTASERTRAAEDSRDYCQKNVKAAKAYVKSLNALEDPETFMRMAAGYFAHVIKMGAKFNRGTAFTNGSLNDGFFNCCVDLHFFQSLKHAFYRRLETV